MKKKELFFVCIFTVSYLVSATVIAGDFLCKQLEKNMYNNYLVCQAETQESQPEICDEQADAYKIEEEAKESLVTDFVDEELQAPQALNESLLQESETMEMEQEADITASVNTLPDEESKSDEADTEDANASASSGASEKLLVYETTGYEYFDDALFIGDSRTVGIMEYGNIGNATFFADSGMSVFKLEKKEITVPDAGKMSFDEVLSKEQYGKIYLMLGINELGYQFESICKKYQEMLEKIRMSQSDAVIFLCANMHVTAEQSQKDAIYNNDNVNRVNEMISALADNETLFYLNVNEIFDDASGSLSTEYSSDSFHVYGRYYMDWVDWLCTKAIQKPVNS